MPPALTLDDPRVMDSTAALDLPDIPKSLLVVGGGYIGLELGTVYADARQRGHGRRDDAGTAAGRRSRSRRRPRQARGQDDEDACCSRRAWSQHEGGAERHPRHVRGRRPMPKRAAVRSRAGVASAAGPNSAIPGLDETRVAGRSARLHHGRRAAAHRTSRRFSRSATSSASRCWRTRRRTKGASPSK